VAALALGVLAGCGGGTPTTVPPRVVQARIVQMPTGVPEGEVRARLGALDEVEEGRDEVLNYGFWQLRISRGRMIAKWTVKHRSNIAARAASWPKQTF
jgi:hypothetical protein